MYTRIITAALLAGTVALVGITAAPAATLASGAYGAQVKASAVATISADARAGVSGGATPGAYDLGGSLASLAQTGTLATTGGTSVTEGVGSGLVTTRVQSNGSTAASGSVTVANPTFTLGTTTSVLGVPVTLAQLGIAADAITSQSSVAIVNGALVGSGAATIANLSLTGALLGGLNLDLAALANPAANTVAFSLAGLTLTLNEQIATPGAGALSFQTNALHLNFANYLLGGATLNGDVVLGHSEASIAGLAPGAVPEPAAWATMVAGFALIGGALRQRRRPAQPVFA